MVTVSEEVAITRMATPNSNAAELQAQYNAKKENLQAVLMQSAMFWYVCVAGGETYRSRVPIGWTCCRDPKVRTHSKLKLIDSLKPMSADRKCFRMIGGTLVERTVGEVLPALEETQKGVGPSPVDTF